MKMFKCETCGNVIEMINDAGVIPHCCGQEMKIVNCNIDDTASVEKHVPTFNKNGVEVIVQVGSVMHPMEEKHYIQWIEIKTDKSIYRRILKPGDEPVAKVVLSDGEKIIEVKAYCNIHGMWKTLEV